MTEPPVCIIVLRSRRNVGLDRPREGIPNDQKASLGIRCFTVQLIIASVIGSVGLARAEYPERQVHIIVPVAPGGGVDVMARLLAQQLGDRLHETFVVENRPGAAGIIGSKLVVAAPADGYTLLYTPSSLSLSVAVHKTPPYDISKDFTPIINVAISPYALVVNPSVPAHSLKELIAYAKANPGKLNFSSAGVGSASHLAGEMLNAMAGINMVHVPNKGMSPALVDLMGGQVQVMFASVPSILKQSPDRLRPIAMAEKSARRCCRNCQPSTNPACQDLRWQTGPVCSVRQDSTRKS